MLPFLIMGTITTKTKSISAKLNSYQSPLKQKLAVNKNTTAKIRRANSFVGNSIFSLKTNTTPAITAEAVRLSNMVAIACLFRSFMTIYRHSLGSKFAGKVDPFPLQDQVPFQGSLIFLLAKSIALDSSFGLLLGYRINKFLSSGATADV